MQVSGKRGMGCGMGLESKEESGCREGRRVGVRELELNKNAQNNGQRAEVPNTGITGGYIKKLQYSEVSQGATRGSMSLSNKILRWR